LIVSEHRWTIRLALFLSALMLAGGSPSLAQPPISKEYQIKAVCLLNFAQFISWPADTFAAADKPFRIGILGEDHFGSFLDETVRGEKIDGHPLVVERYARVEDAKDCQILFISGSEDPRMQKIIAGLKETNILTVGETKHFCRIGGMIHFFILGNKIHFKINLEAVKQGDLVISSKVLRLADAFQSGRSDP